MIFLARAVRLGAVFQSRPRYTYAGSVGSTRIEQLMNKLCRNANQHSVVELRKLPIILGLAIITPSRG